MTTTCSCGTTDGVCRSTGSACTPRPVCDCAPAPGGLHAITCGTVSQGQPGAMRTPGGDVFYADNADDAYYFWGQHGALPLNWAASPDLWVQLPGAPDGQLRASDAPGDGSREYFAAVADGRWVQVVNLVGYFAWAHLRPELQDVSRPIGELALAMLARVPDSDELVAGLRKLLEAKDCLVRAAL